MKILLLDNYDSFTYNLLHVVKELGATDVEVVRNDQIELDEVDRFDKIILSPGPGIPEEAGLLLPIIKRYAPTKSILGVCLGHQAICEVYGGTVTHAKHLMHGKQSIVSLDHSCPLFDGLANEMAVARYHSLIGTDLPDTLKIVSTDNIGEVMAVMDEKNKVFGLQFHPESILTPQGSVLLKNFLAL